MSEAAVLTAERASAQLRAVTKVPGRLAAATIFRPVDETLRGWILAGDRSLCAIGIRRTAVGALHIAAVRWRCSPRMLSA